MSDDQITNLHRRMDSQDKILAEIRDKLVSHIAEEEMIKPAISDLVALWRGSKIIGGILGSLAALGAGLWAFVEWTRNHLR